MGCKGGNTYAVVSPYMIPTSILIKSNNNSSILKIRMIIMQIKITVNFKKIKIATYHFEEEADDRNNGRKKYLSSKQ